MNIMRIVIIDKNLKRQSDLGLKIKYINPEANNSVQKKDEIPNSDL